MSVLSEGVPKLGSIVYFYVHLLGDKQCFSQGKYINFCTFVLAFNETPWETLLFIENQIFWWHDKGQYYNIELKQQYKQISDLGPQNTKDSAALISLRIEGLSKTLSML